MTLPADETALLDGACHCGAIRFQVRLRGGLAAARRCSCSYCGMRGAVALTAAIDDLSLLEGADRLATYQFNTMQAEHHFCSVCGIYTHHRRRSNPNELGINAACLGISPFDFAAVTVVDGVNHPNDTGRSRVAGILRFEPATDGSD
ncbi:GFA family protein [Sphingomonas sp.]|uniref:GFA family protein n=1 Tax=Sphingomonas sp. TaxID=28214 RepID=UPI003B3AD70F